LFGVRVDVEDSSPLDDNTPSPPRNERASTSSMVPMVSMLPETPLIQTGDDVETPDAVRPGRGGPGRRAARAYDPEVGGMPDPLQKIYHKDSKRSVIREFDADRYFTIQRRKAKAVDHFFAVAQDEKHRVDGEECFENGDDVDAAFGTQMPEQRRYKYRGHSQCNLLQVRLPLPFHML